MLFKINPKIRFFLLLLFILVQEKVLPSAWNHEVFHTAKKTILREDSSDFYHVFTTSVNTDLQVASGFAFFFASLGLFPAFFGGDELSLGQRAGCLAISAGLAFLGGKLWQHSYTSFDIIMCTPEGVSFSDNNFLRWEDLQGVSVVKKEHKDFPTQEVLYFILKDGTSIYLNRDIENSTFPTYRLIKFIIEKYKSHAVPNT